MDLGTVLSVAQTLFAALQCKELKDICVLFGYESELENLRRTVCTVRAVLKDAEAKQDGLTSLSSQAQLYIDELKDAVYDADDLLDEFITMIDQKKELIAQKGAILGEVRLFFSRFNRLSFARNMSKSVKKIRMKLDAIAVDYGKFGFKIDYEPIKVRREETCSYVNQSDIIGRDADVQKLLDMLVSSQGNPNGCNFVSIVGIGGLGKTALAQLVYNDPRVKAMFSLRMWACVSDQDQNQLGIKENLIKILRSAVGDNRCDGYSLDQVQCQLRQQLAENKYLPELRRLRHLKELKLVDLPKLEYVENGYSEWEPLSFPCLEDVYLQCLPKLEAWSRGSKVINEDGVSVEPHQLWPRLKNMVIIKCPKMSCTPVEGLIWIYDDSLQDAISAAVSSLMCEAQREMDTTTTTSEP